MFDGTQRILEHEDSRTFWMYKALGGIPKEGEGDILKQPESEAYFLKSLAFNKSHNDE